MSKKVRKKKSKAEKLWRIIKVQTVFMLIVVAAIAYYYVGGYASQIADLKTEAQSIIRQSSKETFKQAQTSIVYDDSGNVISLLKGEKDVYYVPFNEIPADAIMALISIEDKKFYKHTGVDYKAIARAAYSMIRKKGEITQGGSTITQQLARSMFLSNEKTWERKVEEIYMAVALEEKYSKEDILEFYLNNVYFSNGYYGIQAASRGYFSKDAKDLDLSELCYLIAIPNSPTYYDPIKNPENTLTRRNLILQNLVDDMKITQEAYDYAVNERIVLNRPQKTKNDYVETYAYYCATRALMESNGFEFKNTFKDDVEKEQYEEAYEEAYNTWNHALFTGGYRIYTTINTTMQSMLQESIDVNLQDFTDISEDGIYELQSAGVCIDNETGQVKAIVGGRSQDVEGYTLNRAFQSYRQPGSSIKPLLVYTPCLERGYTPDSVVCDQKLEDGPSNASKSYSGNISLRQAVAYSKNTVAWQLYEELTPEVGMQYLLDLGFSRIDKNDYGMAACLGGLTNGVSPLEMAKGYATIYNDGFSRDPSCIEKITDTEGNIIYEASGEEVAVYKENSARTMTNMLQSVITDGTAKGINLGDMPCAGKTGTTNDNRDGWFVGYTSYYTTSIWVGYDMPKKVPGLTGSSYPAAIWETYMSALHQNMTPVDFLLPVNFIGHEEQQDDVELDDEDTDEVEQEHEVVTQTITQTFEGTEIPEGAIPDNAQNITITQTVEP